LNPRPSNEGQARELARRVTGLLADGLAATVPDLGRALHVRDADIRDVLRHDSRFERRPAPPGRSPQARPWALAEELVPARPSLVPPLASAQTGNEPGGALAGFWRLTLAAVAPRSVGEAIVAARPGS